MLTLSTSLFLGLSLCAVPILVQYHLATTAMESLPNNNTIGVPQEAIRGYLSQAYSRALPVALRAALVGIEWASVATKEVSSYNNIPVWAKEFLEATLLRFVLPLDDDAHDYYKTINTAIVLLTAWAYYRSIRTILEACCFVARQVLLVWTILLGLVRSVARLVSYFGRPFSYFWNTNSTHLEEEEEPSSSTPESSSLPSLANNAERTTCNDEPPLQFSSSPLLLQGLPPRVARSSQWMAAMPPNASLHRMTTPPEMISPPPPHHEPQQPPPPLWVPPPLGRIAMPVASFPTTGVGGFTYHPPSTMVPPPPVVSNTVFKIKVDDSEDGSESNSEDDKEGDWDEEDCLEAMKTVTTNPKEIENETKPIPRRTKNIPATKPKPSTRTTVASSSKRKRERDEESDCDSNSDVSMAETSNNKQPPSKKQRLAIARANAQKWADQTFR